MSGRIEQTFSALKHQGQCALVTFLSAGDPDMDSSLSLMNSMSDAGADILELGIPFSDPVADGPVIQRASQRALAEGATLGQALELVRRFRKERQTPIILFGYINPFFAYGVEAFAKDAAEAGADGVLVVDLPPEEALEFQTALKAHGLRLICLVSPNTSEERLPLICDRAEGFLYYVSMTGITGTALEDMEPVKKGVARLRRFSDLPICVGFGISTPERASQVGACADGVVVGTALVSLIESGGRDSMKKVSSLVSSLKEALV